MKWKLGIITMMMVFLLSGFVTAIEKTQMQTQTHIELVDAIKEIENKNTTMEKNSSVRGLENALLFVSNENARARIEANMLKIKDKDKSMIQNLTKIKVIELNNKTYLEGNGKAKFLSLIPTNRKVSFVIGDDGNVTRIKRTFDFIYKDNIKTQ